MSGEITAMTWKEEYAIRTVHLQNNQILLLSHDIGKCTTKALAAITTKPTATTIEYHHLNRCPYWRSEAKVFSKRNFQR